MKIQPEHYAYIRDALAALGAETVNTTREFIAQEGKAKNPEMRLRWDLSYRANLSRWFCDNVYSYANDDHIDTALRAIMRELYPH